MLDKFLLKLKLRDVEPSEKSTPRAELIGDPQFHELEVYRQLESTPPSTRVYHEHEAASLWQLPLPFDVLFTIINAYFVNDQVTILNLRQICRSLAELCRPFLYQTATIRSHSGDLITASEKLAALLSKSPDIVDHIRTLRVLDYGKMFEGSRPITREEESLCYVLTRPYPKLNRLELSLHVVWTLLPTQVQHACEVAFSLPTLQEVTFDHIRIPVDIFRFFKDLRVLEMRGEASLPEPKGKGITATTTESYCLPERMLLKDETRSGFVITNVFHQQSALRFSKMKHLQLYLSGERIKLLKPRLDMCLRTLTILELYLGTWGGLPTALDLGDLQALTSLTLTSDISMMPYGSVGTEGPFRFSWLITTLASCPQPSRLESIKFIIRIRSFGFAGKLPWTNLDALFSPTVQHRWPMLQVFDITHVTELKGDIRRYVEGSIEEMVLPAMPALHASEVLYFGVSDQWLEFWRM